MDTPHLVCAGCKQTVLVGGQWRRASLTQLTGSSSFGARRAMAWEAHSVSLAICCQLEIWPLAFLQGKKHVLSSTSGRLKDTGSSKPRSLMKVAKTQCQSSRRQKLCNRAKQIFSAEFCVRKKVLKFPSSHLPGPSGRHFCL